MIERKEPCTYLPETGISRRISATWTKTSKPFTREEATRRAKENNEKRLNETIVYVFQEIDKAVNEGKFSVSVTLSMCPSYRDTDFDTIVEYIQDEYRFTVRGTTVTITISWEEGVKE